MNLGTKIALAAGGLVVLAAATATASPGFDAGGDMSSNKKRMWAKLEAISELTETQRYFLMLVAKGEGNFNPGAHNGSASERAASAAAADNNPETVQRVQACGIDPARLRTGSWTTFQFLAPYISRHVFEIFGGAGCMFADPTAVPGNLNLQIVLAIEHARRLQNYTGWTAYPTVGNLRLGWASPGFMGYISKHRDRLDKYRSHARNTGLPNGIVDAQISRFPDNPGEIYEALRATGA